jgi:hypothetical protein
MQDALALVNSLSDSQIVELTKELFKTVYSHLPYKQVKQNWESVPDVARLAELNSDDLKRELPPADSAQISRLLLEQFAKDPECSPVVLQSWEAVRNSDHLILDAVISLGLIVNLTLLVATTKLDMRRNANGSFEWSASKTDPKKGLVKAILDPFARFFGPKT